MKMTYEEAKEIVKEKIYCEADNQRELKYLAAVCTLAEHAIDALIEIGKWAKKQNTNT